MARPRLFDRDAVLDAAMQQFWLHGFHGTSTDHLCSSTGLGRSSLYNTFTNKAELFRECLALYLHRSAATYAELLAETDGAAATVEALLAGVIDDEIRRRHEGVAAGCLSVNSIVELAGESESAEAVEQIEADTQRRIASLSDVLRSGQAAGEIDTGMPPMDQAEFVNAAVVGIRVAAKRGVPRRSLEAIAAGAVHALRM